MRTAVPLLIGFLGLSAVVHAGEGAGESLGAFMLSASQPLPVEIETPPLETESPLPLEAKSKGKAFLLSFLVPGLGEYYTGATGKAKIFFFAELSLWLTYGGFISYRDWRIEDYRIFAAAHAGVDLDGKSGAYFIDVGNYNDIEEYNAAKLRARSLPEVYRDVESYYWRWDEEANRVRFEELRISADTADNHAIFVLGAIFANHVVSAVDAVWSAHNMSSGTAAMDWKLEFGDGLLRPYVNLNLCARF